jgi:hypothetical protein
MYRMRRLLLLCTEPHALHVQLHDLGEGLGRVLIEALAPGGAGIGEQNIDMVGVLADLGDESLDLTVLGEICGNGVCLAAGGEGVQGVNGFLAGFGLAGGDEDFGASSLEETVGGSECRHWCRQRRR